MARFGRIGIIVVMALAVLAPSAYGAGEGPLPEELKAEKQLFRKVNEFRTAKGLNALVEHNVITREARKHSNYMYNHGELSHDKFEERVATIMAADPGIQHADRICEITASAEGYDSPGPVTKKVAAAWRTTSISRQCLLDKQFKTHSVGIGVQVFEDVWYITLIAAYDNTPGA